ncbi:MAG: glycosyltransferase, partial [Anaerolineales bacterium]|nr:glycosyltransferase [Anaerolineales bacterium]
MKIALLSEKYTPDIGGLAISTGRMGHLLAYAGHEVRVFAPSGNLPATKKQTLRSSGVNITRFGAHKRVDDTLVDWFELVVEEHKREPFDLLHSYFLPMAGFVAAYAGKYLNISSVVSIRGNDIERAAFDPSKFSHVMYALQNASAVTTNASELAKKAKAFVDRDIELIPNGIDAGCFKPMKKNEGLAEALGLGAGKRTEERNPIIGFVGELREKKGMEALLAGYAKINEKQPISLLIVGEVRAGEDKKWFDEFLQSNPNLKIILTGYIS